MVSNHVYCGLLDMEKRSIQKEEKKRSLHLGCKMAADDPEVKRKKNTRRVQQTAQKEQMARGVLRNISTCLET